MPIVTQTQGGQSSAAVNGQSLDYIAQQVIQQCGGAPDTLVQSVLQNTIREFYFKSTAWREVIGPYSIGAGVGGGTIYLNPVDQYSQCHLVLDVFVYPDTTGAQTQRYLLPEARQQFGATPAPPLWYFMDGPDKLILDPLPDISYGPILYVYMSLMPVLNTGQLPNIAITHHFDGLFYGTLWRLCSMPNKPWTVKDSTLLNEWRRRFRQEIMVARDIANRAWSRIDGAVRFPNFAGRGSQNPNAAGGQSF